MIPVTSEDDVIITNVRRIVPTGRQCEYACARMMQRSVPLIETYTWLSRTDERLGRAAGTSKNVQPKIVKVNNL